MAGRIEVVCVPDSFKEALGAAEVAEAMARGCRRAAPDVVARCCPGADGGEGTLAALRSTYTEWIEARVTGPVSGTLVAGFGVDPDAGAALIEAASVVGLGSISQEHRNPGRIRTQGIGELVLHALDRGVGRISLALGGTASCDGGLGLWTALGGRALDAEANPVEPVGDGLAAVEHLDGSRLDRRLEEVVLEAWVDVGVPLVGEGPSARMFLAQKGATPAQEEHLVAGLEHWAARWEAQGLDARARGTGAAGGLGFGVQLVGGALRPGASAVLDVVGFDALLGGASLVITGEGRFDAQTAQGKLVSQVVARSRRAGVPVVVVAGRVDAGARVPEGVRAVVALGEGPVDAAVLARTGAAVEEAVASGLGSWLAKL